MLSSSSSFSEAKLKMLSFTSLLLLSCQVKDAVILVLFLKDQIKDAAILVLFFCRKVKDAAILNLRLK